MFSPLPGFIAESNNVEIMVVLAGGLHVHICIGMSLSRSLAGVCAAANRNGDVCLAPVGKAMVRSR